jgi:glycosyltransferase involved in cell wall biosynthesis
LKILLAGIYVPSRNRKTGGPIAVFSNLIDTLTKIKLKYDIDIVSQSYLHRRRIKLSNSTIINIFPILRLDAILSLAGMLSRKKYDVINVQGVSELNVIVSVLGKISGAIVVYSCHGSVVDEIKLGRRLPIRLLVEERLIVKFSDVLVTVSEKFKSRIQTVFHYPRDKIYVVYNGISEDWLIDYSEEFYTKEAPQYLLFVGAPSKIKGFDLLLKAFSTLKKRHKHLRLLVVGKSPDQGVLKIAGEAVSDISFVSDIDQATLRKIYRRAAALVLPSRLDSFPLVVLEALSQGLPVAVSDQVGTSEIIKDGESGLIFKSNDVSALERCLERILSDEDLRKRIAHEGRKLAACRTWSHVLMEYFKLFESLRKPSAKFASY